MFVPWLLGCSDPVTPAGPVPPDQAELEVVEFDWVDDSRETPALGSEPGAPDRTLHTWVWVGPSPGDEAGARPLLLMSHGIDGHPTKFDAFASALAEEGIVVASAAFPVSNGDVGLGGASIPDLADQPADLAFVLDRLVEAVGDESSPLWGRFDPSRIAALGHSMGGATLLGLARFDGGDPRIRTEAYLAAAAPLTVMFGDAITPSGPPTLVMHGLDDPLSHEVSETLYAELEGQKWYLGIAGSGHADAIESQEEPPIASRAAAQAAVGALIRQTFFGEAGAVDAVLSDLESDGNTVLP